MSQHLNLMYRLQLEETLNSLKAIWESVEADYVDGRPKHLSAMSESAFHIIRAEEMEGEITTVLAQEIFRNKNVVITARSGTRDPTARLKPNFKKLLQKFRVLGTVMTIQGGQFGCWRGCCCH